MTSPNPQLPNFPSRQPIAAAERLIFALDAPSPATARLFAVGTQAR